MNTAGQNGKVFYTYSKTLEYNSFLTLTIWTMTRRAPRGKTIMESTKEPEKESEHMALEQRPPKRTICQPLYREGLCISRSSDAEADDTEISSWITYKLINHAKHIKKMSITHTFQYNLCVNNNFSRSRAPTCWMNLTLDVLVAGSPNEIKITLGSSKIDSSMSSTRAVARNWDCKRWPGPANLHTKSCQLK